MEKIIQTLSKPISRKSGILIEGETNAIEEKLYSNNLFEFYIPIALHSLSDEWKNHKINIKLIKALLSIESGFWNRNEFYWQSVFNLINTLQPFICEHLDRSNLDTSIHNLKQ